MHCGGQGWRHVRLRKRRLFFGSLDEDLQEGEGEELHIDQSSRKGCQSTYTTPRDGEVAAMMTRITKNHLQPRKGLTELRGVTQE